MSCNCSTLICLPLLLDRCQHKVWQPSPEQGSPTLTVDQGISERVPSQVKMKSILRWTPYSTHWNDSFLEVMIPEHPKVTWTQIKNSMMTTFNFDPFTSHSKRWWNHGFCISTVKFKRVSNWMSHWRDDWAKSPGFRVSNQVIKEKPRLEESSVQVMHLVRVIQLSPEKKSWLYL